MPDQDYSKSTPAPYKGAQARLQALNQSIAGGSIGRGGSGSPEGLRPLMAGIEANVEAEAMKSELMGNLNQLRRKQSLDANAMQTDARHEVMRIENTPTTGEIIKTAVTGAMVLEAGADALWNSKKEFHREGEADLRKGGKQKRDKGGNLMWRHGPAGPIPDFETYPEDGFHTTSGIGKVARGISNVIGKIIPAVGSMREGLEEAEIGRIKTGLVIEEMQKEWGKQFTQKMDFLATMEASQKRYNQLMIDVEQGRVDAIEELEAQIAEANSLNQERLERFTEQWLKGDVTEYYRSWDAPEVGPPVQAPQQLHGLLDLIAMGESSGNANWNAMNQGGNKETGVIGSTTNSMDVIGRRVTDMTIDELKAAAELPVHHPDRVFAVGRLQWGIKNGAFADAVKAAGLKGSDKMTPENQRKMERAYFYSLSSVKDYMEGHGSIEAIHSQLTDTWMSLKDLKTGKGKHDTPGLNQATVDEMELLNAISSAMLGLQMVR